VRGAAGAALLVSSNVQQEAAIVVRNLQGQSLLQMSSVLQPGENRIPVSAEGLVAGTYYITLVTPEHTTTLKMVKQ
jgi:hypothetical protein